MSPIKAAATSVSVSESNSDTLGQRLLLELGEVLDDAVVDHGQASAIGQMRVGVLVGRSAVGGPAGVTDAGQRLRERISVELVQQVAQFSGLLPGCDGSISHHCNSG